MISAAFFFAIEILYRKNGVPECVLLEALVRMRWLQAAEVADYLKRSPKEPWSNQRPIMRNSSDESLLFAISALQLKFIEPHQLLDAGNAWFETKNKSIGHIIVERKYIREPDRSLLEQLVARRIDNAGSVEGSLQGIANDGPSGAIDFTQLSGYTDLNMPPEWQHRIDQFGSTTMQMPSPSNTGNNPVGRSGSYGIWLVADSGKSPLRKMRSWIVKLLSKRYCSSFRKAMTREFDSWPKHASRGR